MSWCNSWYSSGAYWSIISDLINISISIFGIRFYFDNAFIFEYCRSVFDRSELLDVDWFLYRTNSTRGKWFIRFGFVFGDLIYFLYLMLVCPIVGYYLVVVCSYF